MKIAKLLSLIGVIAMTGILAFAFITGDFSKEGAVLLSLPWGLVSMVDLYVGFFLFSGWIIFREQSILRALIWIVLMMVLGFFTGSLYTFLALQSSKGNWNKFWMGHRAVR